MTRVVLVLAVMLGGCMSVNRHAGRTLLVVSTVGLACDTAQTVRIARDGWPGGRYETNWIMPAQPSVATIVTYNVGVALANVALWMLLPEKYRPIAPAGLTAVQIDAITHNYRASGVGFCGGRHVRM